MASTKCGVCLSFILIWTSLEVSVVVSQNQDENPSIMVGKYELQSDPKEPDYDEYLKALEFSDEHREMMHNVRPVVLEVSRDKEGKTWTLKINSRLRTLENSFQSGIDFEETIFDNRRVKSVANVDDPVITKVQNFGKFEARQVLNFHPDGLRVSYSAKGKYAEHEFKRIKSDSETPIFYPGSAG